MAARERGSILLQSLGQAFRDVLMRDLEGEKVKPESKEQQRKKRDKKGKKDEKKDEKRLKKDHEEKQLVREGQNSLITYPNPSSFSVFSHIRHFVLQSQLCSTFNSRLSVWRGEGDSEEESDGEEEGREERTKMPVVVGLGVQGVFTIIHEVWQSHPLLCFRALMEFLNILQGQCPSALKNEPKGTTTALFELLMKMVVEPIPPDDQLASDLSSVACSCLLSLVVALGDTGKMLAALSALLTSPPPLSDHSLLIPEIFYSLQDSVKAVLLGAVVEANWLEKGVPAKSLVEGWTINLPLEEGKGEEGGGGGGGGGERGERMGGAVASDGQYLYVHGPFGLAKVGSGYGNTKKGFVYCVKKFRPDEDAWLGLVEGLLLYYPVGKGEDTITAINTYELAVERTLKLDADCLGSQCLFSDGKCLGQIKVKKEGGCVLRKFTTLCSPLVVVEEKQLQLSQKTLLCMGRAKYDSQESIHTLYQDHTEQVVRVMASRNCAAVQTASGKLFYTGSGVMFGITGKDVPKGEWSEVTLPDKNVKVEHCSCDNAGTFCLLVSNKGTVYFSGLNRKGEGGEAVAVRGQPKPTRLKKVSKLKDQEVESTACGSHATAVVSKEGKLLMFGDLEEELVDKSTGVVTDLLGVPVSQVAMGRSHTCVLTQHGVVYTFGNNSFGQCGRNYQPPQEEELQEEGEEEAEEEGVISSEQEEEEPSSLCPDGEHKWEHNVCMICSHCRFCTGYGPGCCNDGLPGRDPGMECGCGSGDSGCAECGCCRVCAGDKDHWSGFSMDDDDIGQIRELAKARRDKRPKKKKKKKEKKEEKKLEKEGMGLQLLFGGMEHESSVESSGAQSDGPSGDQGIGTLTNKPSVVTFPDNMTAMQIDCGTFHSAVVLHSGDVYVFGHGKHGQLGQGNTKDCGLPVKVPLPGPASQVACGDNHTVVLLHTGEVYTFGKQGEGQLGRQAPSDGEEGEEEAVKKKETWHLIPHPIPTLGGDCKAEWVGARGNHTFIAVDESLISDQNLGFYRVFADTQIVGLVPPKREYITPHLVMINREDLTTKKFDSDDQQSLLGCGVCIDPEYSVLWSYSYHSKPSISLFNPVTINTEDPSDTILSSSICLPRSKEARTSRYHLSLNLLSCLHTLALLPPLTLELVAGSKMHKFGKDDYSAVIRFNSHGGGWGYSNSSVEAIRFSTDTDVILGGFGLYGGRGQYNAEVKLFDLGEEGDQNETDGVMVASQSEVGYSCERQHTYRILLDKPVLLLVDHWYTAYAAVSSPSGTSSDAGSSGQREIQTSDKVTFQFKSSKRSNNGTDVGSGQIPELLYRFPELDTEGGTELQLLGREFSSTVSPTGLSAVLQLLQWVWQNLSRPADTHSSPNLSFITRAALGLLRTYIREAFPEKGRLKKPSLDSPEIAQMIYEARTLLQLILSSRPTQENEEQQRLVSAVVDSCCLTFRECFHAFFPSVPLKWFALCQQLQYLDPQEIVAGVPTENLLSTVLEALSEPTVSYIGLGYDTNVSLNTVLYNSEPDPRFPMLSEYMQTKALEENEGAELLGFNTVATKLLAVVTAPIHSALIAKDGLAPVSPVVRKAGQLLLSRISEVALCIAYPESASLSGISLKSEKEVRVVESSVRFPEKESGHPTQKVKDLLFSVNRSVLLQGVAVYGGTAESYKYTLSLLKKETVLSSAEGRFTQSDYYGDNFVNLSFKTPTKLEADDVYTLRTELSGSVYDVGVGGKYSLIGPGRVTFTLHESGTQEADPTIGPVVKFLYSPCSSLGPQNVIQLSVYLARTLLEVTVRFLERALASGLTSPTLDSLGSSFMFSALLPTTLAQLGPVACKQPKYAVEVLDLVKQTLPVISAAASSVSCHGDENSVYSDTKHLHYASVETDHPYKAACVSHYRVKFPDQVQWMTLEFDPRTGFAQREDKVGEILIPRRRGPATPSPVGVETVGNKKASGSVSQLVGVSLEDLHADWERFGLDSPPGLVLVPGNEVHISVFADTEYEKRDASNHFGLKCQVIGYEWTSDHTQCLLLLEKELVTLGAMCAASLLTEDTALPFAEDLSATDNRGDVEKADMRIVQAAAQEVLSKHSHVLSRGLVVDTPTIQNVIVGDIPIVTENNEQLFLQDFISCKLDTPGGRLARWLQPDRAVDPEASELEVPSVSLHTSQPSEFTVRTKDQDGKLVYVGDMKVEVKAMWLGGKESSSKQDRMVDGVMGVRKPTFKRSYNPTKLNGSYLYHSISMMMPFRDYSFEELRLFAPKLKRSIENIPLKSNDDGVYIALWIPASNGSYVIQVFIDSKHTGQEKQVEVVDLDIPEEEEGEEEREEETKEGGGKEGNELSLDEQAKEEVTIFKPKMKQFLGKEVAGVRIRAEPSFMSSQLGIIKPGQSFSYTEEIKNDAGTWVKLSDSALKCFDCSASVAYALSYSSEKKEEFLVEKEPPPDMIHTVKKRVSPRKPPSPRRRHGGPGIYEVVQCGSAGHNIRSKPGMRGTPVGRLAKGNKIDVVEEVENDDGIWLKLYKDSVKKFCDTQVDSWTLAVALSGRIFLSLEGDESYQSQIINMAPQTPPQPVFPTAASVFGTPPQQKSIFGTPLVPPAPPPPAHFQFGVPKLQFGSTAEEPSKRPLFKFDSLLKRMKKSEKAKGGAQSMAKPSFSIGSTRGPVVLARAHRRSKPAWAVKHTKSTSENQPKPDAAKEEVEEEEERDGSSEPEEPLALPTMPTGSVQRQALSPAVAECQRAIYAAFLWQEGLVHDALASAVYLKFHPELTKEMKMEPKIAERVKDEEESERKEGEEEKATEERGRKGENEGGKKEETKRKEEKTGKSAEAEEGNEQPEKKDMKSSSAKDVSSAKQEMIPKSSLSFLSSESDVKMAGHTLPPTLNHLVTFWDEISAKVLHNSSVSFAPPKVPEVAQELQRRYEEEKKELDMCKKEKDKKPGAGGGIGSTLCELCDQSFPDPVTYHMKEVHAGCGKHGKGWGYNSRGTFCSGWAGNCGDGGRGGSTWYLMCKDCHTKYLAIKEEGKKRTVRTTPLPKMRTRKPGKLRVLPVISAVQGMIQNAKFLLEISCPFEKPATTPTTVLSPGTGSYMKQLSLGRTESFETKTKKIPAVASDSDASSEQRPLFLRSTSLASHSSDKLMGLRRNKSIESHGREESPLPHRRTQGSPLAISELSITGPIVAKPSIYLARLMYNRSRHGAENREVGYKKLLAFVLQYHDLNGLRVTMKQSMRAAGVRTFAMECLQWLLQMVRDPCIVHDILWQFSRALSTHPLHQMASKVKADREREEKGQKQLKVGEGEDFFLGKHPLTSLEGAGFMQQLLRSQFHCFLQAVANKMPGLPMGSAVQRMAMQCWCLHFQPQDHSFLLQSNVFANISQALSGAEEGEGTAVVEKRGKGEATEMTVMEDILSRGRIKVSSNEAMVGSLTDGSTETFWESRDEPRGRPRQLTVTFEQEKKVFAVAVHIDNQKDSGQRVESVSLLVGREEDGVREVDSGKLAMLHCGWRILIVPPAEQICSVVRLEAKGLQNNIRVRQLQVLAPPTRRPDTALTSVSAQQKACEEEALRVFRLLTSQVFGGLLIKLGEDSEEETDSVAPKEGEKEGEVREHMADILLAKNKLSSLQKQVCVHIIRSVHTECEKMREEWEGVAARAPPQKVSRQPSVADAAGSEATGRGSDTYCFELLSMLIGLSQSDVGCAFLSQQEKLVQELFSLLHIATPRIQMQSLSLLRHILPVMGPKNLAPMISVLALPPIGYSAIAEAVNSAATLNTLGILDCLLAVIAKALSVQVKAKGRGTNILQALTGDSTVSAVTLASLINPSAVPGETTIRNQRWYLKGSIDNAVASEVVKLMKDMTKGVFGAQWQGMSKAAIGQAVLHLTKINEEARVPNPGMYSQTLWLCLAALCVIDEEHAEALSSGQWLGQDGKPKDKPLCDNHDDGETQALILCDRCGNLCGECDRVLHYSKKAKHHQRQVFKEEEEAVKVELHEGCGRIKLYWTMALADYRTLKGLIEFRETGSGGGKGACRFCGTVSNTGLLPIGSVCVDPECQERAANVCDKTLPCGHACCGVKEEESCLPCLHGCATPETSLKQDADDMCMVCYTEGLSFAACIQLKCGHVFHYHCCRNSLVKKWSGPMITFRFMFCSLCVNIPISHPALSDVQTPVAELYEDVKRKCLLRLEYENQMQCEALNSTSSKFYQKPLEYGMSKYAYYVCYKCKKSYYGGEAHCAQAASVSDEYDPSELVCPSCSNVGGAAIQVCPKHGTDFLEYKCRYCCSVAVYFCFGTTHFCNPCHDDFQRLTGMAKSELPQCPVGPCAKPLEGTECPLHVKHPPTGEEFALGCGVCRNAQTF